MRHLRWDGLGHPGIETEPHRRIEIDVDARTAPHDPEQSPPTRRHGVGSPQPWWQCLGIERTGRPHDPEVAGKLGAIAQRAVQLAADALAPLDIVEHPGPLVKRRPVADVLAVEARQVGDPITIVILAEGDDASTHQHESGAPLPGAM